MSLLIGLRKYRQTYNNSVIDNILGHVFFDRVRKKKNMTVLHQNNVNYYIGLHHFCCR